ncbi:hypothetical protein [Virgisporangium aurantiacum]|uniref:hypothetical protein n=1 Tax=Virgisporangium aurantiacum TaxID=175570 RepID=UPI0019516E43|nr:hypothetical protein [Virgisporangium aurantiacum]
MDPYSYPLMRRLVRPASIVVAGVAISVVGGLAWHGGRVWLVVPIGMTAFVAAVMVLPAFIRAGGPGGVDVGDSWGWLTVMSALLVNMAALFALPAWYDQANARPVTASVVTADSDRGPGHQLVGLEAGRDDLGNVWVEDDRDLAVGDRVVVYVDRWGWARITDGSEDRATTLLGYGMGAVGLAGFVVLLAVQARVDRREFVGRERRRDGRTAVP